MAPVRGARSAVATMVGYALIVVIAYFVVRLFVGTVFGLIRALAVVLVVGGLLMLYLRLKLPKE